MSAVRLAEIALPDFGMPGAQPEIPAATHAARVAAAHARAAAAGHQVLVVYADREHSANIAYLTGFEPRFEEALLILGGHAEPALVVGGGHASGEAGWIHFGVGTAERVRVRIQWRDGEWSDWYQLYANQFARIVRGRSPAQLWLPPAGGGGPG